MDKEKLIRIAKEELKLERDREKIEAIKEKLKKEKWYHRLLPFVITIQRRKKL